MKKAVVLLLVLAACGKRGDPRPPVPMIPQATSDLVVTQRAGTIVLSWGYPALTTAGRSLPAIRRIFVYRHSEQLQPALATTAVVPPEPDVPEAITQFAAQPTLTAAQFAKVSERVGSIESADLAGATVGATLTFSDQPSLQADPGRPVRLTYAVVTEGPDGRSDFSNMVTIVPLAVAVAPANLTATAAADGVKLEWKAPETSVIEGTSPVIAGYNIYRGGVDLARPFGTPINEALVEGTTYTDVPAYGEHQYRVTAVATTGPPRLESELSPPATVTFKDLIPPPPPASVSALVETAAVRLVWDAVEVPDLAGYRIQRAEGSGITQLREVGKFPLTALITETNYRDPSVQPGISYRFEVTAFDKSGNESAPVSTGWVLVPRTP